MTTVDGFIADSSGRLTGNWTNWDQEMRQFYNDLFATIDTIIGDRGRKPCPSGQGGGLAWSGRFPPGCRRPPLRCVP